MIQRVKKKNNIILDYIGDDIAKCLYLYLDYKKYGLQDENIKFWIQTFNEEICSIVLLYYNGMHIYSKKKNIIYEELCDLIIKESPSVICAEKNIVEKLSSLIDNYEIEYGYVRELKDVIDNISTNDVITQINKKDLDGIIKLILSDEIGEGYSYDGLYNQISIRNTSKYGRNYIIKLSDFVVAHAGTGAEDEKCAVLNFVITDKKYRRNGLAKKVVQKVCKDLVNEGKIVYLINYSMESTNLYDKIGFKSVVEIGKLIKKY